MVFSAPGVISVLVQYAAQDTVDSTKDSGGLKRATFKYDGTTVTQIGSTDLLGTADGPASMNIAAQASPSPNINILALSSAAEQHDLARDGAVSVAP